MAARITRIDARFLIGIALVVAAVAGVWLTVAAARATTSVLVSDRTIVPGQVLEADDVRAVEIALGAVEEQYLSSTADIVGTTATRTIAAGELIPRAALESAESVSTTTVVVDSATAVAASVQPGSAVEVWVSDVDADGVPQPPRILVADATVVAVVEAGGMVRSDGSRLELVIPRTAVPDTLAAIAAEAALSVVPTGGAR